MPLTNVVNATLCDTGQYLYGYHLLRFINFVIWKGSKNWEAMFHIVAAKQSIGVPQCLQLYKSKTFVILLFININHGKKK